MIEPGVPVGWRRTAAIAVLPGLVLGLLTFPLVYHDVAGEQDLVRMATSILYSQQTGIGWQPGLDYSLSYSFGYYWLLDRLLETVLGDPSRLLRAINLVGNASAVFACACLALLMSRLFGVWIGLAITVITAFSPVMLEAATTGHPFLLSAGLLFPGALVLLDEHLETTWPAGVRFAVAAILLGASLTVRADSLLVFPWLLVAQPSGRAWGPLPRLLFRIAVLVTAFVGFLWLQRLVLGAGEHGLNRASTYLEPVRPASGMIQWFAGLALGAGLVTLCLSGLAAAVHFARRPRDATMAAFLVLAAPCLVFWLPNPTPARHFFWAIVGLAGLLTYAASHVLTPRRAFFLSLAVVVGNQLLAEVTHRPVVNRYRWAYAPVTERRATPAVPIGWYVANHRALEESLRMLREEGRAIARTEGADVVMFGNEQHYAILGLLERGGVTNWSRTEVVGLPANRIERETGTFYLVLKKFDRPRDALAEYLKEDPFPDARIYVQPSTRSRHDRTDPPPHRVLHIDPVLDR